MSTTTQSNSSSATTATNTMPQMHFTSRRSPVLSLHASVATSQPLASEAGLCFLRQGANAADAAVAVAAVLAVTEPCSTGIGGDMFCLYYDNTTNQVTCVNGSGRSPAGLTLDLLKEKYPGDSSKNELVDSARFKESPHAVTVPGAVQGWQDVIDRYGSGNFTLSQLLQPAIALAEQGWPVGPVTAILWQLSLGQIAKWYQEDKTNMPLTIDGKNAPQAGQIMKNPDLAQVLRDIALMGVRDGFYNGPAGQAIVDRVQELGGCLTIDDLKQHTSSTFPEAITTDYRGYKLWQVPPNGQGVAALIALAGLQHLEKSGKIEPISPESVGTADYYHTLIEMMRLGFADNRTYVADPDFMKVAGDQEFLLNKERIANRVDKLFDPKKAAIQGNPDAASCTVSFQVVDSYGNAISFVNSNFWGFGTGIVPHKCGFTLQNRGFGFNVSDPEHVNVVAPNKRPYHTIIPGMLTHDNSSNTFYATLTNMGGHMQPQGHLHLTVSLLACGLDPQTAIDLPRFCIFDGTQDGICYLEEGIDDAVIAELVKRGHKLKSGVGGFARWVFGRAQIILRHPETGVLWAGSDGRADGCAMGY